MVYISASFLLFKTQLSERKQTVCFLNGSGKMQEIQTGPHNCRYRYMEMYRPTHSLKVQIYCALNKLQIKVAKICPY